MAISLHASTATWTATTTGGNVSMPTHSTGDMLLARVAYKSSAIATASVTTSTSGWTKLGEFHSGTTNSGVGTGSVAVAVFWKIAESSSEAAMVTTTSEAVTVQGVSAISYQKGAGETWENPVGDGGSDTTSGTAISATIQSHVAVAAGDMVDLFYGVNDNTTCTVPTVSQSGITFDTVSEQPPTALDSTTGHDIACDGGYRLASSGTSSAAAVITGTLSTSETEAAAWQTRLRVTSSSTVTPGTASLTTTRFTPKVTIDQKFIPGVAALVTTRFTPTVRLGFVVVPGIASLTTTRFTPSVTVSNNVLVVPGIATLTTTRFTPTVQTDTKVIPGIGTLTLTRFTPTVQTDTKIIPGVAALVTTRFTPTVTIDSGGLIITPGAASLTLTRFAPTVLTPRLVTPGTAGLVTTGFAPTVLTPRLVVPGAGTLTLSRFTPTVTVNVIVIPGKGTLVLTPFSPTLTILTPEVFGELFPFEFLRHVALVSESSDSAYPSEG